MGLAAFSGARRRPRALVRVVCAALIAVPLASVPAVAAAPSHGTTARSAVPTDDVFPTQAEVDAARSAVTSASAGAAQAQARYDAASIELLRLQGEVSLTTQAAAVAEAELNARTAAAAAAAATAGQWETRSTAADLAVRREAALLWQSQDGPAQSLGAFLTANGPQDLADLASAMGHIGARRQATLEAAVGASHSAKEARRLADVARSQQEAATSAAKAARDAAAAQARDAEARTAQLQQQQQQAVAELSRLKGVAADVEQRRQDAIAAEEARAAAARAAAAAAAAAEAAAAAAGWSAASTWAPSGGGMSPAEAKASARAMMGDWGFGDDQWGCLESLWTGESDWRWWARNPSSGAYGIPQSLPATKMATAGADWLTNANTQISWGLTYIKNRYGSPCGAWSFWLSKSPHWY